MRIKTKIIIVVSTIIFIFIAAGVSYGYFIYNKDLATISLTAGSISINLSNINGNLNLIDVIPKSNDEGISSDDYLDFTINATVDTDKIYYEVYILPESGNTLNTAYLKTYLTDQANNVIGSISSYNTLTNSEVEGGKVVYHGIVNLNNDHSPRSETKNLRLRLWLDENYPGMASKTFAFNLYLHAKNVDENYS